jgi:hypothetical protein
MSLSILNMSIEDDTHIKREIEIMPYPLDLSGSGAQMGGLLSPTASKLRDVNSSYKAGKITAEERGIIKNELLSSGDNLSLAPGNGGGGGGGGVLSPKAQELHNRVRS